MDLLKLEDLTVDFFANDGWTRAVDHVSFNVPANRCVALVGESGSGKTVISQAVLGLLPPKAKIKSGRILLFDGKTRDKPVDISKQNPEGRQMRALRGDRISIIFQEPMTSLSPLHTIGDQISEAARLHRDVARKEALSLTRQMLGKVRFPDPERALRAYPFELSGGLRQRAVIAMALICQPSLVIADEPTTALDVTIQAEILKLMRDMRHELHMSLLLITHDFGVVANMADDVVVIYHGQVMEMGSAKQLFRDPHHPYLKALLNAVPTFGMEADQRLVPIRPIEAPVEELPELRRESCPVNLGPMVQVDHVTKTFTSRKGGEGTRLLAMDRVSLTIQRGECLGLVGESGSGKTTVAKAILRAFSLDSGSVYFDRGEGMKDIASFSKAQLLAYRRCVQMIFQDPFSSLNPRMTINESLLEPLIIHRMGHPHERAKKVSALMRLVGLDPRYLRRYPHSFSGGQRQRIGIARALALDPELILCDEPTSALDVSVQAQVLNLLLDLKHKLGLTYLFVSHNLAVVDYIADRIAVMCHGRIVEVGPTKDVIHNPVHPYTQTLLKAVPEPSLDHPLDFAAIHQAGGASNPSSWPKPYTLPKDMEPKLVEISKGHSVCAPGWGG
ncbi:ABC transporter ATP-binding protein [Flexibacterium corallicola]|uniref:ABC transporter ATP-binding protein n=1 Tax=Flexibacterium corallicola TaxID=3037259 RepID=UPI00286EB909|nr:ABC transporter ATP-binding protein [Pseudovibrio sp. M1P-2-3]